VGEVGEVTLTSDSSQLGTTDTTPSGSTDTNSSAVETTTASPTSITATTPSISAADATPSIDTTTSSSTTSDTTAEMSANSSSNEGARGAGARVLQPTAASKARQGAKAAVRATPMPPPVRTTGKTVPVRTAVAKKACSTFISSGETTLSDLTMDMSTIGARESLDTSMAPPPPMRRAGARASARGAKQPLAPSRAPQSAMKAPMSAMKAPTRVPKVPQSATKAPQTATKAPQAATKAPQAAAKAPQATKAPAPVSKNTSRSREGGEEEITDEMMRDAYDGYLQAKLIRQKSEGNRALVAAAAERQVFQAFTATEELRQRVMAARRRKAVAGALGRLEAAAGLAGRRLGPALALLEEGEQRLARLAMGLGKVKHHVLVKGVTIETEEQAQEEMEGLCRLLQELVTSSAPADAAIAARTGDMQAMTATLQSLLHHYESTAETLKECRGMLGQGTCLATQWASLSLSLAQLRATQPGQ